ncbi:MAG: hypothetical protein WD380_03845 [Gaiellaceae bacterium]
MTERILGSTGSPRRRRFLLGPALLTLILSLLAVLLMSPSGPAAPTSPSIVLDQCRNGAFDDQNNCVQLAGGQLGWVNGNAGKTNAHFIEGHSIPYRSVATNVPATPAPGFTEVVFAYNIKHSGENALDFLTYYDNLEPHLAPFSHNAEDVVPPSGTAEAATDDDTAEIPRPSLPATGGVGSNSPNLRFTTLRNLGLTKMAIFGGEFVGVDGTAAADAGTGPIAYVQQGNLSGDIAETQIRVRFRDTGDDGLVVLGWAGHIARSTDWGLGNSASAVNGSPYHMALVSWTASNVGAQDRSLKADAVFPTGTIIIQKVTTGGAGGPFGFTGTGTGITPFNLTTVTAGVAVQQTFAGLAAGSKTVTESSLAAGFEFVNWASNPCTGDLDAGSTFSNATKTVTIDLDDGEELTCTFTNRATGRIRLVKALVPSSDPGRFNLFIKQGTTTLSPATNNVGDTGSTGYVTVTPGNFDVSETAGTVPVTNLADYTKTIVCRKDSDSSIVAQNSGSASLTGVPVGTGESITCTITNTRRTFMIVTYVCEGSSLYSSNVTFPSSGGTLKVSEATGSTSLPTGSTEAALCSNVATAAMDARYPGVTSGAGQLVKVDISP